MGGRESVSCPRCGLRFSPDAFRGGLCPACRDEWEAAPVVYASVALFGEGRPRAQEDWGEWLARLPMPCFFEFRSGPEGIEVWFAAPPGSITSDLARAWSSFSRHRMRLHLPGKKRMTGGEGTVWLFLTPERMPQVQIRDPASWMSLLQGGRRLRIWLLGRDEELRQRLRAWVAYHYGAESGVDPDTPNPWGWRLALIRGALFLGGAAAALGGGLTALGVLPLGLSLLAGGGMLFGAGLVGTLDFVRWRSIPREWMEKAARSGVVTAAFTLHDPEDAELPAPERAPASGAGRWLPTDARPWPSVRRTSRPYPTEALAGSVRPAARSDPAAVLAPAHREDAPAAPPAPALLRARWEVGRSVATDEPVGIDPDGHGLIVGGSGTGKSSAAFALLRGFLDDPEAAPGLFLVDPHLSLSDALLAGVDALPAAKREVALRRLLVVDPHMDALIPLNLLTLENRHWASGALISLGRRLWEDYWGPRMQAALDAMFRIAAAWNAAHPAGPKLGLAHIVFAAFNREWRHEALRFMPPHERASALALDALLGQAEGKTPTSWVTEVASPIISKVMALELSPWLFASLHQDRFADMAAWVRERRWIVVRPDTGRMGLPAARVAAAVVWNVFESVFRETASPREPAPFLVVIDEAQEIAAGMRLEHALAEGRKFGMRVFVLTQSLTMLRKIEGFEPVVQALLANTSTQMFFSPDPDDRDTVERVLERLLRYGAAPDALPTLTCWLRARLEGEWQPPVLIRVEPMRPGPPEAVDRVIREVMERHPDDYVPVPGGDLTAASQNLVEGLEAMAPPALRPLLRMAMEDIPEAVQAGGEGEEEEDRLGL